jgi:hypothetical protein
VMNATTIIDEPITSDCVTQEAEEQKHVFSSRQQGRQLAGLIFLHSVHATVHLVCLLTCLVCSN